VTREQVEAILAKLPRYESGGENWQGECVMDERPDGAYVEFDAVRKVLEGMIDVQRKG